MSKNRIMDSPYRILIVGIVFAVLYWILESVVNAYLLGGDDLLRHIFMPRLHEIWVRFPTICIIILLAVHNQISVTKQRQTMKALRESEERYRDLFENANDLIQSIAPDGRFIYVNRAWREALGYSAEEIADLSVFDIISSTAYLYYNAHS